MPRDTDELRETLGHLFPDLSIDGVAKESGQRVVYYCHFEGVGLADDDETPWSTWGRVVMKVCAGIDAPTIAYMQMEIEVLNGLDSPYFPTLYWNNTYTEDPLTEERLPERLFISIESFIDSLPLSQCSERFKTEPEAIKLLLSLIDGGSLLWQHERRLVHRDLKPDNILIRPNGDPVIIDLGILRETGAKGVTQTQFWGPMTLLYASPEQVNYEKKSITFKTDLFSLATIVYELISGENPYAPKTTNSTHEVLTNIATLEPPRLDTLGFASSRLSDVISQMQQKLPYKRYRSINSLREDLLEVQRMHT